MATSLAIGAIIPRGEIALAQQEKGKIAIFQFKDRGQTADYSYFSYIIADSIAVELRRKGGYPVYTHPVSIDYVDEKSSAETTRNHILYLSNKGEEFRARFIISGMFSVRNNKITIKSQLFDIEEKKIMRVEETRSDLGALMFEIIDGITAKINSDLTARGQIEAKTNKTEPGIQEKSPFIPIYRTIRGTAFGADHGKINFSGKWGAIYEDTDLFSLYLHYRLKNINSLSDVRGVNNSSAGLQYHAFSSQPENYSTSLLVKALTMEYIYSYPVLGSFSFSLAGGIGVAFTNLNVYDPLTGPSQGPAPPITTRKSKDVLTRLTLTADYEIHPLLIKIGYTVNRLWYTDEPMNYNAFFISAGFRL